MKINTNSWHYKLIQATVSHPTPRNVCQYVWRVIMAMLLVVLYVCAVVVICLCLVAPLWLVIFKGLLFNSFELLLGGAVFYIFISGFILWQWIKESYYKAVNAVPYKPASPFAQWIKDKHNKVCTGVEYVDN